MIQSKIYNPELKNMKTLKGQELKEAQRYIRKAADFSGESICSKFRIGAVLEKNGKIIGKGFNGPIGKACNPCLLNLLHKGIKTELCFAMHAEERAVVDAIEKGHDTSGTTLYTTYVKNNKPTSTEDSFCAHCSRILLESDVERVVLPEKGGLSSYDINEFYDLSFDKFIEKNYIM